MASANSNVQITDLDFDSIKNNLKTFLRSQEKFKDYDFEGSSLSILLDILAYNTHYNSYYLNMVANEMFMDTAVLRNSVVSHAKLLNYVPKSSIAPTATVNIVSTGHTTSTVSIPKFTKFQSEAVDGTNYTYVTTDIYNAPVYSGVATFTDVEIKQGEPISLVFAYNSGNNPKQIFSLPDANIDTTSLLVQIQNSATDLELETWNLEQDVTLLNGQSKVYFLQEGLNGTYEIYFGDGILGKKLIDGNVVLVSYIVTQGSASSGANNFVLLDEIGGITTVNPLTPSTSGGEKESIDSIKFQAPRAYLAQGRAVSYVDYITAIQQNKLGFAIDSVNVWGGEDNNPPAYGQVFISIKPADGFRLTDSQKKRLLDDVVRPISVVTVTPTIIDPDYTYMKITSDVVYDQRKTTLTSSQIAEQVRNAIRQFAENNLNTFNAVFSNSDLSIAIRNSNSAIIANDSRLQIQKKFYPSLGVSKRYVLNYGVPLRRSVYQAGIYSSPTFQYYTRENPIRLLTEVYMEEIPFATSGIESISVINPGFNYTEVPSVVITGDGSGAVAHAVVKNGYISEIVVDEPGNNYTQAIVSIVNASGDTSGTNGSAYVMLQGRYGRLRTYFYNDKNIKSILDENVGTIDYQEGIITLNNFSPFDINDPLGQLTLTANPLSTIVPSSRNRIVTLDEFDPNSITVNVIAR